MTDTHDNGEDEVVYANLVKRGAKARTCTWCNGAIPTGFAYFRIVRKSSDFRSDPVCLNCWTQQPEA